MHLNFARAADEKANFLAERMGQRFAQVSYFVDGTRLVVNSNLFFEPDRVTLRPEAVLVLRSLYRQVQEEQF